MRVTQPFDFAQDREPFGFAQGHESFDFAQDRESNRTVSLSNGTSNGRWAFSDSLNANRNIKPHS